MFFQHNGDNIREVVQHPDCDDWWCLGYSSPAKTIYILKFAHSTVGAPGGHKHRKVGLRWKREFVLLKMTMYKRNTLALLAPRKNRVWVELRELRLVKQLRGQGEKKKKI